MGWRDWTGVGERRWKKTPDEELQPAKTLWDWLQLLIVPAILIVVTLYWSAQQTAKSDLKAAKSDQRREDRRIAADRAATEDARNDVTLRTYLDQMSGLMLDKGLLASRPHSPIRAVARTLTLTTLRRLDGERKAEVIRFVFEARLLNRPDPLVNLDFADLTGAELKGANLTRANLTRAFLRDANLVNANLTAADLTGADLREADLRDAILTSAILGADLTGANLTGADLIRANLTGADLTGANFTGADLIRAKIIHADLRGANLTGADLMDADLTGALLGAADLRRADLTDANLTGADLTGAKLEGAKGLPKQSP